MNANQTLRVLTWNIRHGGSDAERLAQAIGEMGPDIAVLTEFRPQRSRDLLERLCREGWPHTAVSAALPSQNGVAVVSRCPLVRGALEPPDTCCGRGWIHVTDVASGLEMVALYVPAGTDGRATRVAKRRFWEAILLAAEALASRPAILIGDLNTGRHLIDEEGATYLCADRFEELNGRSWHDAFRSALHGDRHEYSWWSNRGGFRLDHAFVSESLRGRLSRADYVTRTSAHRLVTPGTKPVPREIPPALSDHAALVVEMSLPLRN